MTRRAVLMTGLVVSCLTGVVPARADDGHAKSRPSRQYTIEQFLATTTIELAVDSRPTASQVLFTSDASGIPNVYTVPFAGGAAVPLTRSTTDSTFAVSYFPKDDRVLFTHDHGRQRAKPPLRARQGGRRPTSRRARSSRPSSSGWSHDDASFFVMTNERDPRFFDVYRHDAGDLQAVAPLRERGRLSCRRTSRATAAGSRSTSRSRPPTATSISGTAKAAR